MNCRTFSGRAQSPNRERDRLRRLSALGGAPADQEQARAPANELGGRGPSDPAGGAGDQAILPFDRPGHATQPSLGR